VRDGLVCASTSVFSFARSVERSTIAGGTLSESALNPGFARTSFEANADVRHSNHALISQSSPLRERRRAFVLGYCRSSNKSFAIRP